MNNRAGHVKTNLSGEMAYQSFVPNPLPPMPSIEMTEGMLDLLIKANSQLAVLESMATRIPNVDLFHAFRFINIVDLLCLRTEHIHVGY